MADASVAVQEGLQRRPRWLSFRRVWHRPTRAGWSVRSARPCRWSWACTAEFARAGCPVRCTPAGFGDVAATVVGHDAVDAHAQAGVVRHRLVQELRRSSAPFIGLDEGEGHARVVVDGQVHHVPADAAVAVERAVTGDAVAHAVDAAESLVSRCGSSPGVARLVAHDRLGRLQQTSAATAPSASCTD